MSFFGSRLRWVGTVDALLLVLPEHVQHSDGNARYDQRTREWGVGMRVDVRHSETGDGWRVHVRCCCAKPLPGSSKLASSTAACCTNPHFGLQTKASGCKGHNNNKTACLEGFSRRFDMSSEFSAAWLDSWLFPLSLRRLPRVRTNVKDAAEEQRKE